MWMIAGKIKKDAAEKGKKIPTLGEALQSIIILQAKSGVKNELEALKQLNQYIQGEGGKTQIELTQAEKAEYEKEQTATAFFKEKEQQEHLQNHLSLTTRLVIETQRILKKMDPQNTGLFNKPVIANAIINLTREEEQRIKEQNRGKKS